MSAPSSSAPCPRDRYAAAADGPEPVDDTLLLLFLCCHPSLSTASQIALTLRAVGGLTTNELARAFMVSEATVTRRITPAKQTLAAEDATGSRHRSSAMRGCAPSWTCST